MKEDIINKIHTTKLGEERIKRNLKLECDVITYCKNILLEDGVVIYSKGKNWYCEINHIIITINSSSYTIITAHISK